MIENQIFHWKITLLIRHNKNNIFQVFIEARTA
jgi:hypothetical protein